jgi:hypothetical protein
VLGDEPLKLKEEDLNQEKKWKSRFDISLVQRLPVQHRPPSLKSWKAPYAILLSEMRHPCLLGHEVVQMEGEVLH